MAISDQMRELKNAILKRNPIKKVKYILVLVFPLDFRQAVERHLSAVSLVVIRSCVDTSFNF